MFENVAKKGTRLKTLAAGAGRISGFGMVIDGRLGRGYNFCDGKPGIMQLRRYKCKIPRRVLL